jgi:TIR domain
MTKGSDMASKCVILYASEEANHSQKVELLKLADRLNSDGVDTEIDLYHDSPDEGWNVWMERMVESRTILVACTPLYRERFDLNDSSGAGGVGYEARLVRERLKRNMGSNRDVIPVILEGTDRAFIPRILADVTFYQVSTDDGYEHLYARLTGRQIHRKPPLGAVRELHPELPPAVGDVAAARSEHTPSGTAILESPREASSTTIDVNVPERRGRVAFDYSDFNGRYVIGEGHYTFETMWSKGSDTAIHCYARTPTVDGVALVSHTPLERITDARRLNFTSDVRTAHVDDIVVLRNVHGAFAVLRILNIKDDTRAALHDEVIFEYCISADGRTDLSAISI